MQAPLQYLAGRGPNIPQTCSTNLYTTFVKIIEIEMNRNPYSITSLIAGTTYTQLHAGQVVIFCRPHLARKPQVFQSCSNRWAFLRTVFIASIVSFVLLNQSQTFPSTICLANRLLLIIHASHQNGRQ